MNLGKAMQAIREEKNLSRREMASELGCTATALWKVENGKVNAKQSTITRFCFVTKTPVARLYLMAMESKDFAPIPSCQDFIDAMISTGAFTQADIENVEKRLFIALG